MCFDLVVCGFFVGFLLLFVFCFCLFVLGVFYLFI